MKIVYHPISGGENIYIDMIINGLKKRKFEVLPLSGFLSNFLEVKIIHLNWYENIGSLLNFLNKSTKLIVYKILGKKVLWTMHNKEPHENAHPFLQRVFTNLLIFLADKIIIHSWDTKKILAKKGRRIAEKTFYLPHPAYIDMYGSIHDRDVTKPKDPVLKLLFVGLVRPYKNLELLIDSVETIGKDVRLLIVGKPKNKEYAEEIRDKISNVPNIEHDLRFIENNELIEYLYDCDLVILPYKMDSVLNSGAVMLSFSYGKSVICPNIGTINDIKDKSALLNYTYSNEKEHKKILTQTIEKAVALKKISPKVFDEWGLQMKNYVEEFHDKEVIIDRLAKLYQEIAD
ncbi:glycosyltransferase family 4 protein [Pareuzebyella sediminis]|uniref:glycosyltransferase family 4 protein n=1 Tax=Pareuzebyella sediminis TaxID=2607998 RepID=UPI0011EEA2CB|nr:glycosyltransferase family 4 protein [Pareuzebyella sediminis]